MNWIAQPTIVSNVGNRRLGEDGGVFRLVTIFVDGFEFITRSGVDLQQNHQGVRVQRNAIVPSSRGINFKTSAHLSWCGVFITRMLCQRQV
jgi:hypothetical protein